MGKFCHPARIADFMKSAILSWRRHSAGANARRSAAEWDAIPLCSGQDYLAQRLGARFETTFTDTARKPVFRRPQTRVRALNRVPLAAWLP
jgi:hypothetical protein